MIQKKKKQLKIGIIVLIVIAILVAGILGIMTIIKNNNSDKQGMESAQEDLSKFKLKTLIVETDTELTETYNAIETNILMDGFYTLKYDTVEATAEAYNKLKNDNNIKSVEPDIEMNNNKSTYPKVVQYTLEYGTISNWGPIAMGLDELQTKLNAKHDTKASEEEIVVAVIDSGFNTEHASITNEEFGFKDRIVGKYNAVKHTDDVTDKGGHGSNVGGIILESTPDNVKILPIKVDDDNEKIYLTNVVTALNYAMEQNVDVVNMSLGGANELPAMKVAIKNAVEKGITIVVASGNESANLDETKVYPACYEEVITIGAVSSDLLPELEWEKGGNYLFQQLTEGFPTYSVSRPENMIITDFSNYGEAVDFVAPGDGIIGLSTVNDALSIMSGTSQASPHAAAAVATILSYNKEFTEDEIYEILEYYSTDLGDEGKDVYYGNGFINFKDYEECTCSSEECQGIFCFGCSDTSCLYHQGKAKKLKSIAITKAPTRIVYAIGEKPNIDGMEVTATYSDNSTQVVTGYTYSPNNTKTLTQDDKKIIVTYIEDGVKRTAEQLITVSNDIELGDEMTGIEITTPPTKIKYQIGEEFNPAGMTISATYQSGRKEIIENTEYVWQPTNGSEELRVDKKFQEGDTGVVITYNNFKVTQPITLEEETTQKILTKIEITKQPTKTTYEVGDIFDKAGMEVTATYSDNTTQKVTTYTYSPNTALTINDTEITVSYTENDVTKTAIQTIQVKEKQTEEDEVLVDIEITVPPDKMEYNEGETFDKTGMVVTAKYSNNTKKIVNSYSVFPTGALSAGMTKVTVSYTEKGVTKTAEQPITVNSTTQDKLLLSISVTTQPTKTSYNVGDTFDPSGMVVTAKYSDGTTVAVTNYTYSPTNALTANDTKITISYTENEKTVTVNLPITVKAQQNDDDDDFPGVNSPMFDVQQPNDGSNNGGSNNGGLTIDSDNSNNDGTTSKEQLAYTGLESYIIPIGIVIVAIGAISFIQIKRYKGI